MGGSYCTAGTNTGITVYNLGPSIPSDCSEPVTVSTPSGSIIVIGCDWKNGAIYELNSINENIAWRKMKQILRYPRQSPVAMLIPEELVYCRNFKEVKNSSDYKYPKITYCTVAVLFHNSFKN